MTQYWNDTAHVWQTWDGTNLPWKDPAMPWNNNQLPWKDGSASDGAPPGYAPTYHIYGF